MQQNVELQRELETLRAKMEYVSTFISEKFDQQKATAAAPSSIALVQTAFDQMRQTEMRLQELRLKSAAQQEENELLKYLVRIRSEKRTDRLSFCSSLGQKV